MAYTCSITYGTTTIDLNGSGIQFRHYVPNSAPSREAFVTDSIALDFKGSSVFANQASIQAVNKAMERALDYTRSGIGDRVWLNYMPEGYNDVYQSEIAARPGEPEAGRLIFDEYAQTYLPWASEHNIGADLIFNRRNFWQGTADIQVPLKNEQTAKGTAQLTIYNQYDGGVVSNYAEIEAADIVGDLPGRVRLTMKNLTAGTPNLGNITVGMFDLAGNSPNLYFIEDTEFTGGSAAANANCSGGTVTNYTWSATTETALGTVGLTADAFSGYYYRILLRTYPAMNYPDLWLQTRFITAYGDTVIASSPWSLAPANKEIIDLGVMRIPPYLIDVGNLDAISLVLAAKKTSEASYTLPLDYLFLLPVNPYVQLRTKGLGMAQNETLTHNTLIGQTYVTEPSSSKNRNDYIPFAGGIELQPGKAQRIFFIQESLTGAAAIARTLGVKLWYRPRRLNL